MIANRRTSWNFTLDRALEWATELKKPLLVFEPLRCNYRWASDRHHRFILGGMADNKRALGKTPALYYPYVEPEAGAGRGLLRALSEQAAVVVTDDYPCFFLPRAVESAAKQVLVHMERIDGNGLLPMRTAERVFPTAFAFRRFLQKKLPDHLQDGPRARPLAKLAIPRMRSLPAHIARQWPPAEKKWLEGDFHWLRALRIDHRVGATPLAGGSKAAAAVLRKFLTSRLHQYAEDRNHPDDDATSGLSPYLHFGQISVHEVIAKLMRKENWTPADLQSKATGARSGWWGMSPSAEGFLDELITWRELGFNMAWQRRDFEEYDSLPDWSRATLDKHAGDPRPHLYSLQQFEEAHTHDPLWNAAQVQLLREGRIHNYLRMLWGKKILEWSASPRGALEIMLELNNKYALDGRDPNSASGILWVLGRYDRAWGPERPIFGTVRYMSSKSTARKLRLREYLSRYSETA